MTYTVRLSHCSVILLSGSQHIRSWPTHKWDYHTVLSSCYQGHSISGHDLHSETITLFCHLVIRVTAYQVMTYTVRLSHCSVILLSGSQHIRSWPTQQDYHTVLSSCYQGHSISDHDLHSETITLFCHHVSGSQHIRSWPTHSETITLFCHHVIRVTAYQVMTYTVRLSHCSVIMLSGSQHIRSWPTQWDYHTVLSSCYQGHSISGHDLHWDYHTVLSSCYQGHSISGHDLHSETITLFCHLVIRVTAYQIMTYTQWDYHTVLSSCYQGHSISGHDLHSETITLFCHHVIRVTAYQVMTYTVRLSHCSIILLSGSQHIRSWPTLRLSHCSVILLSGSQHIRSWPTHSETITVLSSCYQGHSISDHDLHTVRLSHCSVIMLSGSQHIRSWPTQWDYHTVLSSCYQGHSISGHDLHSETITLFCHLVIRVTAYQIMTYTQWDYHCSVILLSGSQHIRPWPTHSETICSVIILLRSWPTHSENITLQFMVCHTGLQYLVYIRWPTCMSNHGRVQNKRFIKYQLLKYYTHSLNMSNNVSV